MNTKRLLFLGLMLSATFAFSQNVGINASGTAPENSAGLDVDFTDKGVLIPRVSLTAIDLAGPISSPTTSLLVYNTATAGSGVNQVTPGYYYWDDSKWVRLLGGAEADGKYWRLDGNSATSSDFLGTTNNIALRFRTNNTDRLQITTSGRIQAYQDGTAGSPTYSFTTSPNMGMFSAGANQLGFSTGSAKRFHIENTFIQSVQNHRFANGAAASPSITFTSNTGTGLFRAGTNQLGFSTGGTERMRIQADGKVLINTASHTGNDQLVSYGTSNWAVAGYNSSSLGGSAFFENTNPTNGYSTLEAVTEYSGISSPAAIRGIAINNLLTHRAIGVAGVANGRDGIGIMGSIQFGQTATTRAYGWAGYFVGDVFSTSGYFIPSDSRLKKDIQTYKGAIDVIQKLNVVSYYFDLDKYPNSGFSPNKEVGFIAQELKEVIPNAVAEKLVALNATNEARSRDEVDLDFNMFYTVDYTKLVPITIEAIQEQQHIIESQKERIDKLEQQVLMLMEKIK